MTLPPNFNTLVQQLNDELGQLDNELSIAIKLIRERIALFPDNIVSIQIFATLNNYVLFTENTKKRIQETIESLNLQEKVSNQEIQEAGEDLSEQLGRILEAKTIVNQIKTRLEH
jgi:hypothetical protein